tara:strand:- start:31 stop:276 length:246 start_codon:yes stop_codon:yes gene_type:complete
MIQAVIIKAVLKLLKKQFKLDKLLKYVEEPNELDNKCDNLNKRMKVVEEMAHEPKEFATCCECKKDIKENFNNNNEKWYDK